MQLSPILLVLSAAAAVIATPVPLDELAEGTPEALADLEDRYTPDWKRYTPDWKRYTPDWKRYTPDWKRGE